jgi:hypothetical protein
MHCAPEKAAQPAIVAEISSLANLPLDQLRGSWSREFRKEPPKGLSHTLLLRTLVRRVQEKAFSGHDIATIKLLDAYARGQGNDLCSAGSTLLIREYRGVRHTVTIAQERFVWQEKAYPNLETIARIITGTNWNGLRFFGLREKSGKGKQSEVTA